MKMRTIMLFKDGDRYQDDVFVAVNGKSYLIQRGVEVKLPYFVAEVLENSQLQEQEAKKQYRIYESATLIALADE